MFTTDQLNLLLGPLGLLVASLFTVYVLWRGHRESDKALIAAAVLRGDEWKAVADGKTAENTELREQVEGLTKAVNTAIERLVDPPRRTTR